MIQRFHTVPLFLMVLVALLIGDGNLLHAATMLHQDCVQTCQSEWQDPSTYK